MKAPEVAITRRLNKQIIGEEQTLTETLRDNALTAHKGVLV